MPGYNRLNIALLIVGALLALLIFFSEPESTALERLSEIDIADINSITIQHNKNTTHLYRKTSDNNLDRKQIWHMTKPLAVAANDFRINTLLQLLNAPIHNKYSENEISLQSTGLADSQTRVKFNEQSISFGITNPATNLRYIKRGGFVYTIEDVYSPLLSANFTALVSLYLLPANSRIEKLILLNQTISKDEKQLWRSNIDISADNIQKAIDHWQSAQAFGSHPYMKRETLGNIFIFLKGQQQAVNFIITDTDPWLILARPELGLEYHLDLEAYDKLIAPQ